VEARDPPVERPVAPRDPEERAPHAAAGEELRHDPRRRVGGDREADPLRHRDDRGVDPDDVRARVDERPAGAPRVERRRVLDDVLDEPAGAAPQGAGG
jgi:hypothetical protein